jgi:cytochrome P450
MNIGSEENSFQKDGAAAAGCPFSGKNSTAGELPKFPMARTAPFDPPPQYAEFRRSMPVVKVSLWNGNHAWLVSRYDDVRQVLADPASSSDITHPNYPSQNAGMRVARGNYRSFITMDAPTHTAHRRMLTQEFSVKRMEAMRPAVQRIVDQLLDEMLKGEPHADLVDRFALPLPSLVICDLLGVPYTDHDFFQDRARILASHKTTPEEAVAVSRELCQDYIGSLIREKDRNPQDDLLSRLVVNHMRPGHLTFDDVVAMSRLLLIAGHETTANTTALGTLLLLQHPEKIEELRNNPALVPNAVEELLRFLDVTHSGRRRVATADMVVAGQLIKAGEGIITLNASANRDESAFPNADVFDIHRDAQHHVAFGYGVHQCLGQNLGRIELQAVFSTLFRRIPTLRLDAPIESLKFKQDMFVYGVEALPIAW